MWVCLFAALLGDDRRQGEGKEAGKKIAVLAVAMAQGSETS